MQTTLILLGIMLSGAACAQSFTEKISKALTFEKRSADNALMIANINGSVTITGYDGDQVLVEVTKLVSGKTEARLEKGKQEVQLGVADLADTLVLYVREGCMRFGKNQGPMNHPGWQKKGWSYQSDGDCDQAYDYRMDFTVKVPASVHVIVSTINHGDITVENVTGVVKANNVNGSLRLTNLQREAEAHTINGDVDIVYSRNPDKACRFYTLNGDINALFQTGLSANMSFESFNGELFTNIDKMLSLPPEIEEARHGEGVKYKIDGNRYRVGRGGALLKFETFNGDVYIKEKK